MSIRTPRSEPITAGVVREQVVALSDLCGSGHCMTGAIAASPRRACGSAGPMDARSTSRWI